MRSQELPCSRASGCQAPSQPPPGHSGPWLSFPSWREVWQLRERGDPPAALGGGLRGLHLPFPVPLGISSSVSMETQPQVFPGTRKGRGACPGGEDKGLWKQIRLAPPPPPPSSIPAASSSASNLTFLCLRSLSVN